MYHISSAKRRKCPFIVLDLAEFTDEEGYGKYLDLHECYEKFINLKGIEVEWSQHDFYDRNAFGCMFFSESEGLWLKI